ncbi:hypothetical protein LTR85_001269 [Meristemomyces frigidus]|nr:hypothetical protein LTR85_001269 [Meristemomyces frigidus]
MSVGFGPEFEPHALVRRFSAKVAESLDADHTSNEPLRSIVAADYHQGTPVRNDEGRWKKHFQPWKPSSSNDLERLRPQAVRLSRAWEEFRVKLPSTEAARFEHRAPTFDDVISMMTDVEQRWDKQRKKGTFGAISNNYRRCCLCIKSHEKMLKILPDGSEYVSLFTGVLTSIVYVATALSKSLLEISEEVELCEQIRDLYNTQKVQMLLMKLYAQIFDFFNGMLDWYLAGRWKRAVQSFGEDLYDHFRDQISGIVKIAQSIRQQAVVLGQGAEIRHSRLEIEKASACVNDLKHSIDQDRTQWPRLHQVHQVEAGNAPSASNKKLMLSDEQILLLKSELAGHIAGLFKDQLEDEASRWMDVFQRLCEANRKSLAASAFPSSEMSPSPGRGSHGECSSLSLRGERTLTVLVAQLEKNRVLIASQSLEQYFDRKEVRISYDLTSVSLPPEIASRLEQWAMAHGPAVLSIAGRDLPPNAMGHGPLSVTAASIVAFATNAKLPVISYFCKLDRLGDFGDGETRETQALIALVYALIRQLFEFLPIQFGTSVDLSIQRFHKLDGTVHTFPAALSLLRDALEFAPLALYCVIDGLQWLDDRSTSEHLDNLVSLLIRPRKDLKDDTEHLKALFTSAHMSRALLGSDIKREDQVLIERSQTRKGGRQGLRIGGIE